MIRSRCIRFVRKGDRGLSKGPATGLCRSEPIDVDRGVVYSSLHALGIAALGTGASPLGSATPQGNRILAGGSFTRSDGTTGALYDLAFDTDPTDTLFRGERGIADWLKGRAVPDAKGFGAMTSLAVGRPIAAPTRADILAMSTAA